MDAAHLTGSNKGVEAEVAKHELVCEEGSQGIWGNEVEERIKNAKARIVELELEVEKRKSDYEALHVKFKQLEAEKQIVEDELKDLRAKNDEFKASLPTEEVGSVVDLTHEKADGKEEEDKLLELMMENKVLECEKKEAEKDVEEWKQKYNQLQWRMLQLGDGRILGGATVKMKLSEEVEGSDHVYGRSRCQDKVKTVQSVDFNLCNTPVQGICLSFPGAAERDGCLESAQYGTGIRKQLLFEEGIPCKRIAPSTPAGSKPTSLNVINICDSDDECDGRDKQMENLGGKEIGKLHTSTTGHGFGETLNDKNESELLGANSEHMDKGNLDACEDAIPFVPTPKRKRAANIITSDSESDEDDSVPISRLKRMHLRGSDRGVAIFDEKSHSMTASAPSRQRFMSLRQLERKNEEKSTVQQKQTGTKSERGIPTMYEIEDGGSEEVGSDSEDESLSGFIVSDSNVSDADDDVDDDSCQLEESNANDNNTRLEESDDYDDNGGRLDAEFGEILSRLERKRDKKLNWELEGDMLSDFGKDPELCMKAVCALYRQQTSDEQVSKETLYHNKRGFSKIDAVRGTTLAQFLTNGDPLGDLKKTIHELEDYDPKAPEFCRKLATHYSKQLFEIYKNKEDPFFQPAK